MLLSAVQTVREAANHVKCASNLRQLAIAATDYEAQNLCLPSGGFGYTYCGDPTKYNASQPGSWEFSLLPYIEQQELYSNASTVAGAQAAIVTPIDIFSCPSRLGTRIGINVATQYVNFPGGPANTPATAFRGDYAACVGDGWTTALAGPSYPLPPGWKPPDESSTYDGVTYQFSVTRITDLRRGGASGTIYCGEKYMNREDYLNGEVYYDNECVYVGFDDDNLRTSAAQPYRDTWGFDAGYSFGSAHFSGFNMAYCDGHVENVSYSVNMSVFQPTGTR